MFCNSFFLPGDDDWAREKHRKALQKAFRREAPDATNLSSSVRQVGSSGTPFLKSLKLLYLGGTMTLPVGHEVHITATVGSRPMEAVISIAHGPTGGVITTIDFLAPLEKRIPCEIGLQKLASQKYQVVADISSWVARLNQHGPLWERLYRALRESYQSGTETIRIEEGFTLKPEPNGLVIYLRTAPISVWWTMGFFLKLGVKEFLDVVERIDQVVQEGQSPFANH